MKTPQLLVLLLVAAAVLTAWTARADAVSQLQQIGQAIQSSGAISASSLQDADLMAQLTSALHEDSIAIASPKTSVSNSPPTLHVSGSITLFGVTASADIQIYFNAAQKLEAEVQLSGSGDFAEFYQDITQKAPPAILTGLTKSTIQFGLNTGASGPLPQGIQLQGATSLASPNPLLKAFRVLQPTASSVSVDASIVVPLFGAAKEGQVQVSFLESATFPVMTTFEINGFEVQACAGCQDPVVLNANMSVAVKGETLKFALSADYDDSAQQFNFAGALQNSWVHAMGLHWLNVQSAQAKWVVGMDSLVMAFSLSGTATLDFAPGLLVFSMTISGSNDILVLIKGVPISSFDALFSSAKNASAPPLLGGLNMQGTADLAIATYDASSQYREGITVQVSAVMTSAASSSLTGPVSVFTSQSAQSLSYEITLYLPVFAAAPFDFQLDVVESSPIAISSSASLNGFQIELTAGGAQELTIDLSSQLSLGKTNPVVFALTGVYTAGSSTVDFTGTMLTPWVHPFGLKWMTVSGGSLTVQLGGGSAVSKIEFKGQASLTFATSPVTVDVQLDNDFQDFLFAVQNIPLSSMPEMYKEVTQSTSSPSVFEQTSVTTGSASFAICNFAVDGYQEGFTFEAKTTVVEAGDHSVYDAVNVLSSTPETLNFDMKLFLPVFTPNQDATFTLTENGAFHVDKTVTCNSYELAIAVGPTSSIQLSAVLAVALKHEANPVVFSMSAEFAENQYIKFSGQLQSEWPHPLGAHWLNISALSGDLTIGIPASLQSLDLSGTGTVHINNKPSPTVTIAFDVADNFADVSLHLAVTNLWTTWEIVQEVGGGAPSDKVRQFVFDADMDLSLTISTFPDVDGVQFSAQGTFTQELEQTFMDHMYWFDKALINGSFNTALSIPIFSSSPLDVTFTADVYSNGYPIRKNMVLKELEMSLTVGPTDVGVSLGCEVTASFKKNPPLTFGVFGSFDTSKGVSMTGEMLGTWENAFGLHGFNLTNVVGELGLSPAACALTACISDLGFGVTMGFGHTTITFVGNAAEPDYTDIFLEGEVHITPQNKSLAPSVLDVATTFNKISPTKVDVSKLPQVWELVEAGFFLATGSGCLGPYCFQEGFGVSTKFIVLEMLVGLDINCTETGSDVCNFGFNVAFDKQQFEDMLKKMLGIGANNTTPDGLTILKLNSVAINQWSQQLVSVGSEPQFAMDVTFMGKQKTHNQNIPQWVFGATTFHDFFHEFLCHLFDAC